MINLILHSAFEAAHQIKDHEAKCKNLHGHNYQITIEVSGNRLNNNNLLYDAGHFKSFLDRYDHKYLNDVFDEDNVTVEYMVERIGNDLIEEFKNLNHSPNLQSILIEENEKTIAYKEYDVDKIGGLL